MARNHLLEFNLEELEQRPFPQFSQPCEVLNFSVDEHRVASLGPTLRKIYSPPAQHQFQFDLNKGFNKMIPKNQDPEYINNLLKCIHEGNVVNNSEIVCWRGLLSKVANTPYESRSKFAEGWIISAQKLGSTIYLCEYKTDVAKERQDNLTEREKRMTFWGHKFEQYVTAPHGSELELDSTLNLNLNEEFGIIVKSKIGKTSLMFGGEVDCCFKENSQKYLELKTSVEIINRGQLLTFKRFKLMKWWVQSFLIGINDIVCGFRDKEGFVHKLESYKVSEIPKMVKSEAYWNPSACFNFLEEFINFVKNHVTTELTPYVFEWRAYSTSITLTITESHDKTYSFLPEWFTDTYRK